MNKKLLSLILVLTLTGAMLMGCAAPMQAAAATDQTVELPQTVSEVSASVLTDVESRSVAAPAAAATQRCPVCDSDACTGANCTGENAVCREQNKVCTGCGSYDCDGGRYCAGQDAPCNPGEDAVHHQARHKAGHNGGHHGHHGE